MGFQYLKVYVLKSPKHQTKQKKRCEDVLSEKTCVINQIPYIEY